MDIAWHNGVIYSEDHTPIGLLSIGKDITAQKQADIAKTKLLSQAAHRLRTPISNMRWSLEVLIEDDEDLPTEQRVCLRDAHKSVLRIVETIDTLLMASRIEAQSLHADMSIIELRGFIREIYAEHMKKYGKKQAFTIDSPENYSMNTDSSILREILSTVISNAVKYTQGSGVITVRVRPEKENVIIEVKDNGMGIPKDEQKKVFAKVYRGRNALTAKAERTGLGLYLARSLIDILGGDIALQSKEGKGTTVTLTIPQK